MVNWSRIKRITKQIFAWTGILSPVSIIPGCQGEKGSADFPHNVTLTNATCNSSVATVITVQNNSNETAILASWYTMGPITYGINCSSSASSGGSQGLPGMYNTARYSIPGKSTGFVVLDNYLAGSHSVLSPPICQCPPGKIINCTVAAFSKSQGWFNITEQSVECT